MTGPPDARLLHRCLMRSTVPTPAWSPPDKATAYRSKPSSCAPRSRAGLLRPARPLFRAEMGRNSASHCCGGKRWSRKPCRGDREKPRSQLNRSGHVHRAHAGRPRAPAPRGGRPRCAAKPMLAWARAKSGRSHAWAWCERRPVARYTSMHPRWRENAFDSGGSSIRSCNYLFDRFRPAAPRRGRQRSAWRAGGRP